MIGPIFALLMGGAEGLPLAVEAWNASTVQMAHARVLPTEGLLKQPAESLAGSSIQEEPEEAPEGTRLMPPRLERAVVRPAL